MKAYLSGEFLNNLSFLVHGMFSIFFPTFFVQISSNSAFLLLMKASALYASFYFNVWYIYPISLIFNIHALVDTEGRLDLGLDVYQAFKEYLFAILFSGTHCLIAYCTESGVHCFTL